MAKTANKQVICDVLLEAALLLLLLQTLIQNNLSKLELQSKI